MILIIVRFIGTLALTLALLVAVFVSATLFAALCAPRLEVIMERVYNNRWSNQYYAWIDKLAGRLTRQYQRSALRLGKPWQAAKSWLND